MLLGFEFPNEPRDLTVDEWSKVDALGSRACKMRPYNLTAANLAGIRERGLAVLLRSNSDGDIDVEGRVRELSRAAWTLREHGIGDIWIIPDNEPNLHHRPVPPDYWHRLSQVVVGLWYGHFGTRALASTVSYLNPPLAVGQGEETWYEAAGSVLNAADGQCLHAYGQLDTGLIGRALMLAKQYTAGLPLIADEVGDSHPTAGWDSKGEALRVYLDILKQHGVSVACLFVLGGTPDWQNFHMPLDVARMLGAHFAQEIPMAIETVIQVQLPLEGTTVIAGQTITVQGRAIGIDGQGMLTATLAEDTRPGTPQYGEPTNVRGIPIADDGWFSFSMQVPHSVEVPAPATLTLSTTEIDLTAFQRGDGWGDAAQKHIPIVIDRVGVPPVPEPVPQPVGDPHAPYLHEAYAGLHRAELAAMEAGDTLLLHEVQQCIAVIDRRKQGDFR